MSERDLKEQRLHPSSLLFSLLRHLRQFIWPLALMFFLSKKSESWEVYAVYAVIPLMIFESWRYFNLRYLIADGELVVHEGVIFKNVRHVPLERIQSIDSTQNFLHRMLHVAEVRVETAGNTEPEAKLRVLSISARDRLREIVFDGTPKPSIDPARGQNANVPAGDSFAFHLPATELALLGLNPFRGLAILGVGVGIGGQLGLFEMISPASILSALGLGAGVLQNFFIGVASVFAVGVAILFISLVSTFIGLHDFTLERSRGEFRTQCGLLTRHTTTIPLGRVQFVSIKSNLLLRLLKRSSIQIETAGGKGEAKSGNHTQRWLMPVVENGLVPGLLRSIDPNINLESVAWQGLGPKAGRRRLFRAIRECLLIAILPAIFYSSWGAQVLAIGLPILVLIALTHAHKQHQVTAWASEPFGVLMRTGVLTRTIGVALSGRVQSVSISSSPFDRRYQMASLSIDTAGAGKVGHKINVEYMQRDLAESLRDHLLFDLEAKGLSDGLVRT
ncbi:MAG: PH domain-containing protein [Planctomycetota bacterium]|nr:PH domain-containing protein [Planctomycetota bacterium]MDG2143757.1 PH domain-containing protein [Planctomycetota bacterium]